MTRILNLGSTLLALTCISPHPTPSYAMQSGDADLCDIAARDAAQIYDIPVNILLSISRVETGRGKASAPWPWTINEGGQGYWFETSAAAIDFAETQLVSGTKNFDVGCFQINLHWHPQAFDSLEDAFDPARNATYAAKFLVELFDTEGDWKSAAAAYHSRQPDKASAYITKIEAAYYDLVNAPELPPQNEHAEVILPKQNRFPLLKNGGDAGLGSLVPQYNASVALIGGTP